MADFDQAKPYFFLIAFAREPNSFERIPSYFVRIQKALHAHKTFSTCTKLLFRMVTKPFVRVQTCFALGCIQNYFVQVQNFAYAYKIFVCVQNYACAHNCFVCVHTSLFLLVQNGLYAYKWFMYKIVVYANKP